MILKNKNTFHLQGRNISYIMAVNSAGDLIHIYYEKKLRNRNYSDINTLWYDWMSYDENGISLELYPQEYPSYGHTDLRHPAYSVKNIFGNNISQLKYKGYKIKENYLPDLEGIPSLFIGDKSAQTLEITLYDPILQIEVILSYAVFDEYDIIIRNTKFSNLSKDEIIINSAYSTNLDISVNQSNYELIYLSGSRARERELVKQKITQGVKIDISNAHGISGHCINPFIIIAEQNTDENTGCVYSMSLIYSGNHSSLIECD